MNFKVLEQEKELKQKELNNSRRGQFSALISVILIVMLFEYCIYLGYSKEARDIAVSVIIGIATVFIMGKIKHSSTDQK